MRTLIHVVLGALAGFALGILAPVGLFALMYWMNPQGMSQGGGTPFALFMIVTIPFGTAAGIIWGFFRANPIVTHRQEPTVAKAPKGSDQALAEILQLAAKLPVDTQAKALTSWLAEWLGDYRAMMKSRMIWTVIFTLISVSSIGLMIVVLLIYISQTVGIAMRARNQLQTIRTRWGDEAIDQLGVLPRTLRPIREMWSH